MFGAQPPSSPRTRGGLAVSLSCTRCGSSVALDSGALAAAREALTRDLGIEPERGSLELTGCCAECAARGHGHGAWARA
jgi:Fe2+ or Zn2+ uptake regulation protein